MTDSIGRQARRGISWNLAGAVTTNALRVLVIVVLGRQLSSDEFGIVAAAVSVNAILFGLRDIGVGQALVQRQHIEHRHVTTAFAVSLLLGVALSVSLILLSPAIERLFGIGGLENVVQALALLFLVGGVASTSRMLCQRELRFRAIALIDASAFAAGALVSVISALAGAGMWALVAGYLTEEILSAVTYLVYRPPPFSLRIDRTSLRELMTFGAGQTASYLIGIVATYGDNFVVGRMLGAKALGYYTRAYDLIKFPSTVFATVVGNVLFPAMSRMQSDQARLAANFRRGLFVNALLLLPASSLLIVLAPEVIELLLGAGWDETVLPFRILAATILMRTSQKLSAIVLQAAGQVNAVAAAYIVYMVLVIGGAVAASPWGIVGIAVSTAGAIVAITSILTLLAMRVCGLRLRDVIEAHGPGLALAAGSGLLAMPLAASVRSMGLITPATIALVSLPIIGSCTAMTLLWARQRKGHFGWLHDQARRFRART